MAQTMLAGKARDKFLARAGKPGARDDAVRQAFATVYGWRPPAELGEWQAVVDAYAKSRDAISDVWMLRDAISYASRLAKSFALEKLLNSRDFWLTALTGLEPFGSDPSGDSCFVSTLATGRDDGAEVHLFNHENGELDRGQFGSIANFIAMYFARGDEDGDSDAHPWSAAASEYDAAFEQSRVSRPPWIAADQLFARSQWLMELPTGDKGFEFARKLASAPDFEVWLAERPRLIEHPVLAHYWILAHYFLGNLEACREAIAIGKQAPGRVAPALSAVVEGLLDAPEKAKFGKLSPKLLATLCQAVRKNAPPELFDPSVPGARANKRAAKSASASREKIQARLAAGEDPWALIAAFPHDVRVHDLALQSIATSTTDEVLAKRIKQYFHERTGAAYNAWPYDRADYDRRLTPVIAAAFRSGLRYDADHPEAYAGVTRALGIADDDLAMAAFEQAIDQLAIEDPRVEFVIDALDQSAHPRAGALLERAALRFFATLQDAKARHAKKAKEGATLDNMFQVDSHFAEALRAALRRDDAIAERLADKTLTFRSNLQPLGTAPGLALRVLSRRGRTSCLDWAHAYAATAVEKLSTADWLDEIVQANLTECAIAIARLAPRDEALSFLRERFAQERKRLQNDLAIRAALLAGLLIVDPQNVEYRGWVERLLGNRTGALSIFSVLRGIEESGVDIPATWVLPHVYAERTSLSASQTGAEIVQATARRALEILGAPQPPAFDDSDRFAHRTPDSELAAALLRPDRYRIESVFERIRERNLVHPDVITNGVAVLRDLYAWSADDSPRSENGARVQGLRALRLQGPAAAPALATLLDLPHMALTDRGFVRVTMRYCGQEAVVRSWLKEASIDEVLAELAKPTAGSVAFSDLLAAHAVARVGERAAEACLAALERRLADAPRTSDHAGPGDPSLMLLPFVVGALGDAARARLRAWAKAFEPYDSVQSALLRAAKVEPKPLSHDFQGPLTVEAECVGESVRYRAELLLEGNRLTWKSTTLGFVMYDLIGEAYAEQGTLEFASGEAARAFAELELRALALRGFRGVASKKVTKAKTKRR